MFWRKLATQMLKIRIGVVTAPSPPQVWTRTSTKHVHWKWQKHEGNQNYTTCRFAKWMTEYIHHPCSKCGKTTQNNCQECDPECALCTMCFGVHSWEQDHQYCSIIIWQQHFLRFFGSKVTMYSNTPSFLLGFLHLIYTGKCLIKLWWIFNPWGYGEHEKEFNAIPLQNGSWGGGISYCKYRYRIVNSVIDC